MSFKNKFDNTLQIKLFYNIFGSANVLFMKIEVQYTIYI